MGQRLVFVPECQSTNSLLSELTSKSSLPEGTVVITANQYAGRGQRGNTWWSEPGMNLTFSALLKPTFLLPKNQFYLTMVASLAVTDFLKEKIDGTIKIKWPNDILVDTKKICGMLIENSIQGETINQSIVGIGLNVNQTNFQISTATSLAMVSVKHFDLNEAWNTLLEKLEARYLQLRAGKSETIREEYIENLFGLNQLLKFNAGGTIFDATIKTVGEVGELILSIDGQEKPFAMKEISFVME
jgi:BirA family transcriptional regulator, biotin operon repressor / biotin---[acetyl-CoA-carboxylase] ligase